jgi:hypothetical protein
MLPKFRESRFFRSFTKTYIFYFLKTTTANEKTQGQTDIDFFSASTFSEKRSKTKNNNKCNYNQVQKSIAISIEEKTQIINGDFWKLEIWRILIHGFSFFCSNFNFHYHTQKSKQLPIFLQSY